jgi:hypothetical protein
LILEKEIILELPKTANHNAWFESFIVDKSNMIAFESISGSFLSYEL